MSNSENPSSTPGGTTPEDVVPIAGDSGASDDEVPGSESLSPGPLEPPPFVIANITDNPREPGPIVGAVPQDGSIFPVDVEPPAPPLGNFDPGSTEGQEDVVPIAGDSDGEGAGDDVVPIAGDSSGPPSTPPPSGPEDSGSIGVSDAVADTIEDLANQGGLSDGSGGGAAPGFVDSWVDWIRSVPAPLAIAAGLVVVVLVVVLVSLLGGSSHSTASATRSIPPSSAPSTTAANDVSLSVSFGEGNGNSFPVMFTVQASRQDAVELVFTGQGLPPSDLFTVPAGTSVTRTYVVVGCGTWTGRVASVNGQAVNAAGNPALENGVTHLCPGQ
jgi:hypothetical protein